MKTFSYTTIAVDELSASDLRREAAGYDKGDAQAVSLTIYEDGTPLAEFGQALYFPYEDRLGIAWGADATWADVIDVESGIEMWLNDGEAWEAAN